MNNKLVSVIVPVYNAQPYLKRCLDSILAQDYKNLQVIIIDDGSNDGSGEICDEYAKKDKRIILLHIPNSGSVRARKEGLKVADGEYVGFVDADDYIEPNMISVLENALEETEADMVHSGYKEIRDKTSYTYINFKRGLYQFENETDYIGFIKKYLLNIKSGRTISYSIWSKLFRKTLISDCFAQLSDYQQFGEDAICLFKCIFKSKKVLLLPVALYNYRLLNNSLSHNKAEKIFSQQVLLCAEIVNELEQNIKKNDEINIYDFLLSSLLPIVKNDLDRAIKIRQFYIEDISDLIGKKVLIYGAGLVGQDVYEQLINEDVDIVAFVDKKAGNKKAINCIPPLDILKTSFDFIIIAVLSDSMSSEIINELLLLGVDGKKILKRNIKRLF